MTKVKHSTKRASRTKAVREVRNRAKRLLAKSHGVASPREWADQLVQVRIAARAVSLEKVGSFAGLEREECVAVLENLRQTASYLSTLGDVLDAARAVMGEAMSREGEPLADLT